MAESRADKYSSAQRDQMAKDGVALPDGSFPIADAEDLANAVRLVGLGNTPKPEVIAHIKARAKALNLTAKLPADWRSKNRKRHYASPNRTPEIRYRQIPVEIRSAAGEPGDIILTGTPIVYDTPYPVWDLVGEFEERMLPGVADAVLARQTDTVFCINHNIDATPLARTTSGTLKLVDTPTALTFEARLDPDNSEARNLASAIRRGDINSMSVGFTVAADTWEADDTKRTIRSLGSLIDVSAVTHPASETTHIEVAQRMLAATPVETMARFDKIEAEVRAGRVLSAPIADKLTTAVQTLHDVLASGGADFDHSTAPDEPDEEDISDDDGADDVTYMDDGTEDSSAECDPSSDRSAELAVLEVRSLQLRRLQLEHS